MIGSPNDRVDDQVVPRRAYEQTTLNYIRVYKHRAHYDFETVHSITDSTLVSHVSFIIHDEDGEDTPITMPLTAVLGRYDDDGDGFSISPDASDAELEQHQKQAMQEGPMEVYLHGNAASMLYKAIKESNRGEVKVCISSTKVDGLVLFPTPNGHSLNYRSATLHGIAALVPDTDVRKKRYAMRLLTNHMFRFRWESTYPVSPAAVDKVKVIQVKIRSAGAKIRTGTIGPFDPHVVSEEDRARIDAKGTGVWSGVVPVFEVLGRPVPSGVSGVGGDERGVKSIEAWREQRNQREKGYAKRVAGAEN
ncbi:uncharacterized protein Z518_06307 [Rhinocladiella mackenziei CBS 650.93]|uniref:Flavin-nucleotide-binding protein n=1 Tax=Rhinocladiella mackenziei CBS 650.93 TaxID=1442369 RepID=A0A0D2J8K8_9EURO|nr:uncharacterized protein Z518_06307 [Rhinocladiella mackenziei CBS 650.93]KIX05435.1 hypothetical protein Z518_06307 [Rhinocladiella mackenziei CBS 650.93]